MNKRNLFLIALLGISGSIVAAPGPLLEKYETNGPVSPNYQFTKTCTIYADKVVMTNAVFGGISSSVTLPSVISNNLEKEVYDASLGTINKEVKNPPVVGGGITSYRAFNFQGRPFHLYQEQNDTQIKNSAPAAIRLKNLLNLTCR